MKPDKAVQSIEVKATPREPSPPAGTKSYFTARNGEHRDVWEMVWDGNKANFRLVEEKMMRLDAYARAHVLSQIYRTGGE